MVDQKILVIIAVVVLVLLAVGAYLAYQQLSSAVTNPPANASCANPPCNNTTVRTTNQLGDFVDAITGRIRMRNDQPT